jgi:hypothetical protein
MSPFQRLLLDVANVLLSKNDCCAGGMSIPAAAQIISSMHYPPSVPDVRERKCITLSITGCLKADMSACSRQLADGAALGITSQYYRARCKNTIGLYQMVVSCHALLLHVLTMELALLRCGDAIAN